MLKIREPADIYPKERRDWEQITLISLSAQRIFQLKISDRNEARIREAKAKPKAFRNEPVYTQSPAYFSCFTIFSERYDRDMCDLQENITLNLNSRIFS